MQLSERQQRELEFYNQYAQQNVSYTVCFDPIEGKESRPWNSYWHLTKLVQDQFAGPGSKLLDFGCGVGNSSIVYSKIGFDVYGFDISEQSIETARILAEKYDVQDTTHFTTGVAESLDYPDAYFDVIAGIDVLHHVDIPAALQECKRVLKNGGTAFFHEPIRVPGFDAFRETAVMRKLFPKEASLERHITHDERKLTDVDMQRIADAGFEVTKYYFFLFARLNRFIRKLGKTELLQPLQKLDYTLVQQCPALRTYCGLNVLALKKI